MCKRGVVAQGVDQGAAQVHLGKRPLAQLGLAALGKVLLQRLAVLVGLGGLGRWERRGAGIERTPRKRRRAAGGRINKPNSAAAGADAAWPYQRLAQAVKGAHALGVKHGPQAAAPEVRHLGKEFLRRRGAEKDVRCARGAGMRSTDRRGAARRGSTYRAAFLVLRLKEASHQKVAAGNVGAVWAVGRGRIKHLEWGGGT